MKISVDRKSSLGYHLSILTQGKSVQRGWLPTQSITRDTSRTMFYQGFLIGLVAGVWLTVLYFIITTRGESIRSYLRGPRVPTGYPVPKPQTTNAVPPSMPESHLRATARQSATAEAKASPVTAEYLDPKRLSSHGMTSYNQLTRLVHDDQTARRLVQYEARLHPNSAVDDLIDAAVDKLLRDRG